MPMKLIFTEMIIFLSIMVGKIENNLSLCDVILLLIAASWMIGFVGYVFHRLKINFFLEISMDYFNAEIEILKKLYYYEWSNYLFKRHIYMDINNRIEIIYQILEYIINKNTNIIYNKYSSEIMKNFMCLKDFIGLEYTGKKIVIHSLNDSDTKMGDIVDYGLYDVFRNILRFHKKICILLYENYRNSDYDEAWNFLINIYPIHLHWDPTNEAVQKIVNEIFKTYWSLAVYFLSRDRDKLQDVILGVNRFSLKSPEIIKNIIVYRALLISTVESNDLSMLTEICYLQNRYINDIEGREIAKRGIYRLSKYYKGMMLYVLVQTAVKTIELGQYDINGFLIKYIVSNYECDMLVEVCEKIIENDIVFDRELKRESLYDRLGVNFRINLDTSFYFFKKFLLLLRIQYKCRCNDEKCDSIKSVFIKAGSKYWNKNKRFDDKYCIEKILSVRKEYGMLSLNKFGEKWDKINNESEYYEMIENM